MRDAVSLYSIAFKLNGDKAKVKHRLNAACGWTILTNKENAFAELERIVFVGKLTNYFAVASNDCLKPLQTDARWQKILDGIRANMKEAGVALPSDIKN